jgi:hypothetical protein
METERIETIVTELNSLFEQQLETLKTVNLSQLTPDQIAAYHERYDRIRELCQELGTEERALVGTGV